jgi:hypothetical protein
MGFQQSMHEAAVYRRGRGHSVLLVGIYVNDIIIIGMEEVEVEAFKAQMKATFQMSDLCFNLGIEVHQDNDGITLRQAHYAKQIIELGGMCDYNPVDTPMEVWLKLSRYRESEEVDATQYRCLVGSLRYLVHTRPDLAFDVGYVSRFMERSTVEHQQAIKWILCYIAGTMDYGLWYERHSGASHLVVYCDNDLTGDIDTSGVLFFFGNCLISWQSLKQHVVALSSCEAEYIATTSAATQALWLAYLLVELLGHKTEIVELKVDNKSALALVKNPVFHKRSKHI